MGNWKRLKKGGWLIGRNPQGLGNFILLFKGASNRKAIKKVLNLLLRNWKEGKGFHSLKGIEGINLAQKVIG